MLEPSLRVVGVLTLGSLLSCAARTQSAKTACPASSAPVASAAPPDGASTPSGGGAEKTSAAASDTMPPVTEPLPRAPSPRDAAAFNVWAAKHEHARDLPLLVAHAFADTEARNVTLAVSYASGEAALSATATVTLEGLLDDSVRAEEHVLDFARDAVEAAWRLTQATRRVRCWPGRGHAELSTAPCT